MIYICHCGNNSITYWSCLVCFTLCNSSVSLGFFFQRESENSTVKTIQWFFGLMFSLVQMCPILIFVLNLYSYCIKNCTHIIWEKTHNLLPIFSRRHSHSHPDFAKQINRERVSEKKGRSIWATFATIRRKQIMMCFSNVFFLPLLILVTSVYDRKKNTLKSLHWRHGFDELHTNRPIFVR